MYWLCSICKKGWAWFVLVGPTLIGLALMVLMGLLGDYSTLNKKAYLKTTTYNVYINKRGPNKPTKPNVNSKPRIVSKIYTSG